LQPPKAHPISNENVDRLSLLSVLLTYCRPPKKRSVNKRFHLKAENEDLVLARPKMPWNLQRHIRFLMGKWIVFRCFRCCLFMVAHLKKRCVNKCFRLKAKNEDLVLARLKMCCDLLRHIRFPMRQGFVFRCFRCCLFMVDHLKKRCVNNRFRLEAKNGDLVLARPKMRCNLLRHIRFLMEGGSSFLFFRACFVIWIT